MLSVLEQPRPRAGSKKPGFNALLAAPTSPYANISNARYQTARSLSLPTPSPSPSRLPSVSPASSSSMLSVCSYPDALDPVYRQLQQRSRSFAPIRSSSPLFETFASDELPSACSYEEGQARVVDAPPSFEFTYEDEQPAPEPAPPFFGLGSDNNTSASAAFNAFRVTKSRVLRILNLPPSAHQARQAIASLYTSPHRARGSTTQAFPSAVAADPPLPIRIWTLNEEYGGRRPGEEDSVWLVYQTHDEARAALALSDSVSVTAALESDLEPFDKLRRYEMRAPSSLYLLPSRPMLQDQRLLSPISPGPYPFPSGTDSEFLFSRAESPSKSQHGYQLSSNPPNARSAFRNGDWICPSASCGAHNFSRNAICIGCGSSRVCNSLQSPRSNEVPFPTTRLASPRFATTMPHLPLASSPSPTTLSFPNSVSHLAARQVPQPPQLNTKLPVPQHPILTPSGRTLAIGGKVQNISGDPLTPVLMFWPDNEPLPEPGQVRPALLTNLHQPPIMNTGNKGPIEHQPGDWICQKCDYLNWRRRKVCQTCFPYAEGNGDSVSSTMQNERLALLATVLAQTQVAQLSLQSPLQPIQPHAAIYQPLSAVAVSPNTQYNHLYNPPQPLQPQRSSAPTSRPNPPSINPRLANQAFARRSSSTPDMLTVGNIVYQTPTSPAASRYQISPEKTPSQLGPLLPSFLKNEIKPARARSPSSLSPSSASSADLSFDEFDDELSSPTRRMAALNFYTQKNAGSGRLSNGSGSTSSLTLGGSMGGSIWSLDRNEDKAWSSTINQSPELLVASRSRTSSFDALKSI